MQIVRIVLNVVVALVVVDAVSSWFVAPNELPRTLWAPVLTPIYAPVRAVLGSKTLGAIDLAPLVVIIAVQVIQHLIKPKSPKLGD